RSLIPATILEDIASPKGSIVLLGLGSDANVQDLEADLDPISKRFIEKSLFSSYAIMKTEGFAEGVNFSNQAFTSSFFRPNIVFLNLAEEKSATNDFMSIIRESQRLELGAILFAPHAKAMLGQRQTINVWLRERSPGWEVWDGKRNPNLAILVAYKLMMNWKGSIRLITVCQKAEETEAAERFLVRLAEEARLPVDDFAVMSGKFQNIGLSRVKADINIFGLSPQANVQDYLTQAKRFDSTCLFIMDSGHENAFA
ncbi:MAG: Na-K-Cl cotransporter, partial [Bacteroidota bacterium]